MMRRNRFYSRLGMFLLCASLLLLLTGCGISSYVSQNQPQPSGETKSADGEQTENGKAEIAGEDASAQTVTEDESGTAAGENDRNSMTDASVTEATTEENSGEKPETEKETAVKTEVETIPESETEYRNGFSVCIDPGHQGSWVDMSAMEPNAPGSSEMKQKATTGTQGYYTGVPEYQLNLDIALALRDVLTTRGYRVVMTREDNDTAISNAERALKASDWSCDVAVRIHANGSDDHSVSGALAMIGSAQNPYIGHLYDENYRLADAILSSYCQATGFANLGVGLYDNMTGLNWCSVPAMILEMGFMTNEHDDVAMQDPSMQEKMVQGIADGIDAYFGIETSEMQRPDQGETAETSTEPGALMENEEESVKSDDAGKSSETETEEERKFQETEENPLISDIRSQFLTSRESLGERWAISMERLGDGSILEYRAEEAFQSASVIKVFIMGAVYDRICYPSSDAKAIYFAESYEGELRYLLEQMIRVSDNEAANRLITILGSGDFTEGARVVNQFCLEHGYANTSVGRRFLESNPTGDNYTSAADCRHILSDIYHGTLVCEEASGKMLDILKGQTIRHKLPAGLPEGFTSANKTGEMPDGYGLGCIENDIAIVWSGQGDYVIAVLSNDLGGRNSEAQSIISQISGYVAGHLF